MEQQLSIDGILGEGSLGLFSQALLKTPHRHINSRTSDAVINTCLRHICQLTGKHFRTLPSESEFTIKGEEIWLVGDPDDINIKNRSLFYRCYGIDYTRVII